ncbi:MAG: hypothetical protein ACREQQ_05045 [Candidatus Binatia bacterium]
MKSKGKEVEARRRACGERRRWSSPKLTYMGHVGAIVQGGGGKLTMMPADPGEPRKTPPSG